MELDGCAAAAAAGCQDAALADEQAPVAYAVGRYRCPSDAEPVRSGGGLLRQWPAVRRELGPFASRPTLESAF